MSIKCLISHFIQGNVFVPFVFGYAGGQGPISLGVVADTSLKIQGYDQSNSVVYNIRIISALIHRKRIRRWFVAGSGQVGPFAAPPDCPQGVERR